jgi:hypothetical protein
VINHFLCNFNKGIKISSNKAVKPKIISFVGFGKNKRKNIEYHLSLVVKNYGICEDIFQGIMHMISQNIRQKFSISNL